MNDAPLWVWVLVAFGVAAGWGLATVLNKRTLQYVDPFALNMIMRVPTIVVLAVVAGTFTLTGAWDLGFGMTWTAFGYITVSAVVTWLVAFNCYYLVLRLGALGVVTPIMATDPLFTAVFAVLLLGSGLGALVITGLVVSTLGVMMLSRWMAAGGTRAASATTVADSPVGADVVPAVAVPVSASLSGAGKSAARLRVEVVALALVTAAGWGLGPVLIELATESLGGASTTMILQSQAMGLLMLVPIVWRRHRVAVRRLERSERQLVIRLVLLTSVLEGTFTVFYYLLIDEIGAVLTVLIIASSPVFSILGGMRLLGERYGWKLAVGAAVTIAGVAIATLQGM